MKFMKLGSKPDSFQTEGNNVRSVASELATDIIVIVGEVKFYLHKFPLLSKSAYLQKSVASANGENDEVDLSDIPGGAAAFEICAKFCYGMAVTLNSYNVVAARCAAEYLGMHETIEKGNLIYKVDVFLTSSIFCSWKDSIIVLQTTKSLLPLSEELKVMGRCINAVATMACVEVSKVDWSYTYNRKKLPEEKGNDPNQIGIRNRSVPRDWWVEDLCELEIGLYNRVIMTLRTKEAVSSVVIGEALKAYAYRRLPSFRKGMVRCGDVGKYRSAVDAIVSLLPAERGTVSCGFLLKLLKATKCVDLRNTIEAQLIRRIGQQLEEASVNDLLIQAGEGENMMYDVEAVQKMVEEFMMQDHNVEIEYADEGHEVQEIRRPGILSDASKLMVVKVIDGYLAEISKDPNLPVSKFIGLAEIVSGISRPAHDALYRAIDMYLKEHPGISKSERKRICKFMDCKKLSVDACMHAVQNERLPLRVVVQVLFFEQVRAAASSGSSTPDLPKGLRDLNNGSQRSSRSTNPEEDWDALETVEELKALKREISSLRLATGERNVDGKNGGDKVVSNKIKGLLKSKIFTRMWLIKGEKGENSGSDSSESLGSANMEDGKSTPSRNRSHSVSSKRWMS